MGNGGPLAGLRVVELVDDTARFAGKVLAESGASVVRIGRPTSGPAMRAPERRRPRRAARLVVRRRQALARSRPRHGGRRRGLPPAGVARPTSSSRPSRPGGSPSLGLDHDDLGVRLALVQVSLTPFGRTGPRAEWQTSDLVAGALGGVLSISGTPDEAVGAWGRQNVNFGSLMACICGLAGVHAARETGRGWHVDLSLHEVVTTLGREPVLPVVVPRPAADPAAGAAPGVAALARRLRRGQRQAPAPATSPPSRSPAPLFEWMAEEGDPEGAELATMSIEEALGRDAAGDGRHQALRADQGLRRAVPRGAAPAHRLRRGADRGPGGGQPAVRVPRHVPAGRGLRRRADARPVRPVPRHAVARPAAAAGGAAPTSTSVLASWAAVADPASVRGPLTPGRRRPASRSTGCASSTSRGCSPARSPTASSATSAPTSSSSRPPSGRRSSTRPTSRTSTCGTGRSAWCRST